jgi:hypothetical protein
LVLWNVLMCEQFQTEINNSLQKGYRIFKRLLFKKNLAFNIYKVTNIEKIFFFFWFYGFYHFGFCFLSIRSCTYQRCVSHYTNATKTSLFRQRQRFNLDSTLSIIIIIFVLFLFCKSNGFKCICIFFLTILKEMF